MDKIQFTEKPRLVGEAGIGGAEFMLFNDDRECTDAHLRDSRGSRGWHFGYISVHGVERHGAVLHCTYLMPAAEAFYRETEAQLEKHAFYPDGIKDRLALLTPTSGQSMSAYYFVWNKLTLDQIWRLVQTCEWNDRCRGDYTYLCTGMQNLAGWLE